MEIIVFLSIVIAVVAVLTSIVLVRRVKKQIAEMTDVLVDVKNGNALMNLMIGYNGTAKVSVQKEHDSTVKLRVIPQLQKSGGFGIVFQMAGVRKMPGKILQLHSGIVHDVSVDHSGIIRRSDPLCTCCMEKFSNPR